MGFDRDRVMEVFARPVNGPGRVGSGYRVTETAVLTAGHVVTGLPVRSPAQVTAGDEGAGRCELRTLGEEDWTGGSVLWRGESADVAVIGLAGEGRVRKKSNHTAVDTAASVPASRSPFAATATTTSSMASAASVLGKLARNGTSTAASASGAATPASTASRSRVRWPSIAVTAAHATA